MGRQQSFLESVFRNNRNFPKQNQSWGKQPQRKLAFEPLEPRVLLSNDTMAFAADALHSDLTLRIDDGVAKIIDSNTGSLLLSGALENTSAVAIQGSEADDSLRIDSSIASAGLAVSFDGGAGDDALYGPGVDSTWNIIGDGAGSVGHITFGDLEDLIGADFNLDTFIFGQDGNLFGSLEGGAGGFDTIELNGSFGQIEYTVSGPQSGTIERDGSLLTYSGFEPIVDDTVGGARVVTATGGNDTILVVDREQLGDQHFAVSIDTGEDVIFNDAGSITSLTINAGTGDDKIDVQLMLDLTAGSTMTINAGDDDDEIFLQVLDDEVNYVVNAGDGSDVFVVPTSGDATVTDVLISDTDFSNDIQIADVERVEIFASGGDVDATAFTGQALIWTGAAIWFEEGPTPFTQILDGATAPWDPVSGAINAVVVDPNDRFTMYVGTVNGGVWKNTGSTEVFFATNESDLTSDDHTILNAFANFLEQNPQLTVEVGGHTDSSGDAAANVTLSLARAQKTRDYLVNTRKIDPTRLTVVGYGEDRPVAANPGNGDQPLNRRAELRVQNWIPLTDGFPSLSVSTVAISPLSSDVIYAGIGRTSSFGSEGGLQTGMLFSNDGGNNWQVLALEELKGLPVTKVLPTTLVEPGGEQVVFVSTFDVDRNKDKTLDDAGGVFRLKVNTTTGTAVVEKISAGNGALTGLPGGHYTDLAFDDVNDIIYAASPSRGVFSFVVGGDGQWHLQANGFQFGTDTDADTKDDLLQKAARIKLAIHEGTGTLYAGVIGPVDNTGTFNLTATGLGLIQLFKTVNSGALWTPMPSLPGSVDNGTLNGLNPGQQGDKHFSLVVDPTNADIIYVGGDAQASTTNAAGLTNAGSGRIFMFSGGNWTQIVGNNADGTAPHADSRGMVFASPYTLFEISDGGLTRLQNPRGETDQGTRRWTSANDGLRISEVFALAYDRLNQDIIVGTQDNGSAHQGAGSTDGINNDHDGADGNGDGVVGFNEGTIDEADEASFWSGTGGDGNSQATISIDTNADMVLDRVLRYSGHNNFNFFQVYEYTTAGVLVNAAGVPSNTFHTVGFRQPGNGTALSGISAQDAALGFDFIPMVVNSNDPTRMLIAYRGIYESVNTNINPAPGQARILPLDEVVQVDPAAGVNVAGGNEVTALIYGGISGGINNNELIIATRANRVQIRTTAGGAFTTHTVTGAGTLRALAVDPDNWKVVFTADSTDVYRTADITAVNVVWEKITGNLKAIGQQGLRDLEYVEAAPSGDLLLVAGQGGVSRLRNPDAPLADLEKWVRFGIDLPNAPVFDVEFLELVIPGEVNGGDKLIAGTLGRGVWSVSGQWILSLADASIMTILGHDTDADHFKFIRDTANPLLLNVFDQNSLSTDPILTSRGAIFDQIQVNTRGGDDTITVDHSVGAVSVPGGILYNGGEPGGNTLILTGGAFTSYKTGTTPGGFEFHDIVDLSSRTQRVLLENVAAVDKTGLPDPLDNAFATVKGALDTLVEFMTFVDNLSNNISFLGTSLGRALNGIAVEGAAPVANPLGKVVQPSSEAVVAASGDAVNLLRRFIETGTGAFDIDEIASFTTLTELEDALEALDESGTGSVSSTGDLTTGFEITLTGIKKKLSGRADVTLDVMGGAINVEGFVDVSADVTLNLTFGVNNLLGFYIKEDGAVDEIVVDHIVIANTDDIKARGRFGFLGVEMTQAQLTVHPNVRFEINIEESGGDGNILLLDLINTPSDYVSGNLETAAAATDVTLTGNFQVSAIIPGLTPFSLVNAGATITWAEIDDPLNAVVTPTAGAGAVALFRFLEVGTQDFLDQLTELKDNLDDLFGGTEIPFLSDGLTDLVGFVTTFQDKVLDPISDALSGVGIPTIQSLVTMLSDELDIALANMGLAYNSSTTELTFHLVLDETISQETKSLGAGIDLADGLADVQFSTDATVDATVVLDVIFGVDLADLVGGVGSALDWFFLKNPSLSLNATITAEDVEAKARFGFLSIGIDQGELEATDLSLTVSLNDPGSNNPPDTPDGRIDLSEIDDGLADPLDFIDITGGGAIHLTLPVEATFVPGLSDIPDGTPIESLVDRSIVIDVADLTHPDVFTIVLGDALTHVGNFTNIDAASLVSLLGQLTFWLDEFRRSDEFADFDIPLVGPALDQVLGFADQFRDALLIDDKDNGTDDTKTLLNDLNAALDDAGLGRLMYFTRTGNNLVLTGLDASITTFTIAGATALGFAASQPGSVAGGEFFAKAIAMNSFGDAEGNLGSDLSFTVTIGSKVYEVELAQDDTTANTAIGDDRWKLVNGQNTATFATAQEMALRLLDAFSPFNPGLAYDPLTQAITFTIDFSDVVFGQLDLPFGFSVEELDDFLKIQTNGKLRLIASGDLHIVLGVFLGPAEPSDELSESTLLTDLTEPVKISTEPRYTAPNPLRTVYGQLSGDATFTLAIQGDPDFMNPIVVTVLQTDTLTNVTADDLVADINAELDVLNLNDQIQAFADGLRIELRKVDGATLTGFTLSASGTNPAVKDIGFGTLQIAAVVDGDLKIVGTKDLPALRGRLTGDAQFSISLNNVNGGSPFVISIDADDTASNRFAFDIVNDIYANFFQVDDSEWFYDADPDPDEETLVPRVEISFSDGRLTFQGKDGATTLNISSVNGIAASELGLVAGSGNSDDLKITLRVGTVHNVTLDGAVDIGDVIEKIENQVGTNNIDVFINDRGSGLTLHDLTSGGTEFKIQIANNSPAGLQLGIVREDAGDAEADAEDGFIEGADIAALTPLDRFFIKATPVGEDPLAGVSVKLSTPTPLTATAQFGFVGLQLTGEGALPGVDNDALVASLTLRLNQPAGSTDGRVSLAELIDSLDSIFDLFDISLTGSAAFDLSIDSTQITQLATSLGIDVGTAPKIQVTANLGDVFADTPVAPTFDINYSGFDELLDFGNVEFNFQSIIAGLRLLEDFLSQFEAFDFLDEPLPVVGISLSDMIDVADKFADAVDEARNNPAQTLQLLEDKLKQAFGLPLNSTLIDLVLVNDDNETVDSNDDFKILKFELNVGAAFNETTGIDFDLASLLDIEDLPLNLGGGADLSASGSVDLKVAIGFDIEDPTRIFLFNETGLEATLDLSGTDLTFHAAVGPLGVFIDEGIVDIGGNLLPGNKLFRANFADLVFVNDRFEIDFDNLLGVFDGFSADLSGDIYVELPVYFPTESVFAGTVFFDADLSLIDGEFDFNATLPYATDEIGDPISIPQLFEFDPAELSLLDQLLLGVDGVDMFLEGLQDILDGEIGGVELPLIGDKLASSADVIGDFRTSFVEDFRKAIEDMANPAAEFAASAGGGGVNLLALPTADPVSKILFELLGPDGLGLLLDTNNSGNQDVGDITFKSNFDEPGVTPGNVFFDWDFKLGQTLDKSAGIGFDIGIPGLGLETTGEVEFMLGWELALGFGLNFDDGFYFDIGNDADEEDDAVELELFVDVAIPGGGITGKLGFLQLTAEDDTEDGDDLYTHLTAVFGIDILNGSNGSDTKLGFSELGRISIEAGIAAEAVVDLGMRLSLSSDLMPSAPTNFPSIVADFSLIWEFGDVDTGDLVGLDELDGSFLKNGLVWVGFEKVGLDLGSYLGDLIRPVADTIAEVTEPIKPFLDFLTEPIPVISDLAGPTSLLDIAAMSGLINPGIILAIEVIDQVIDISHMVASLPPGELIMYFDDYLPSLDIYGAKPDPNNTGFAAFAAGAPIDLTDPNLDLEGLKDTLLEGLDFLPAEIQAALNGVLTDVAEGVNKMLPGGSASSGFSLPIIEDPSQIFGMLMGQPAVLLQYNMAPLIVEAEFSQFFPIYGPLGVSINAEFFAQFGPFTFGYDTLGIQNFAAGDFKNPLMLFDGFFVGDLIDGNDVPELQFDAGLWAAAELNLGIARGGVGGGLFAEIDFNLHDPNDDGRVRIMEIVTNVLNEFTYGNKLLSPLAMFDITGKLTAELFAFLKVDFGFFEIDEKFQITPPLTLLDFESNFERYPTLATELPDGVLQLNMGKFAEQRIEGDLSDFGEDFYVKSDPLDDGYVLVWSPGLNVSEGEAQKYKVSNLILALGGDGNDTIDLSQVDDDIKFELEGNEGADTILAGTGTGAARILGGAGNDTLTGGGGDDTIFGETGDDTIDGMGGKDWLFGDGDSEESILGSTIVVVVKPNNGNDILDGGDDADLIFGAGGLDTIVGGAGDDVLIGDGGTVTVGDDRLVVTKRSLLDPPQPPDPSRLELAVTDTDTTSKGAADDIDGEGGNDRIYGGIGNDILEGGDDHDVIWGESGMDTIGGGAGNDVVFGDFGKFEIFNLVLEPEATVGGENDLIHGDAGNDKLVGGAGKDTMHGDEGADNMWGGTGQDSMYGGTGADFLFGNADADHMEGGDDGDILEGGGGDDFVRGNGGGDLLVGGYGSDNLDGQQGSDTYKISARGGSSTQLTIAYDSGTLDTETDTLILVGTDEADTVLLRAMADFYFPTRDKLIGKLGDPTSKGLTDRIFESGEPDKLRAILQALEDAYGPHTIPDGLIDDIIELFVADVQAGVLSAINTNYVVDAEPESTVPSKQSLIDLLTDPDDPADDEDYVGILLTGSRSKLQEIQDAITNAYGTNAVPDTMFDAIINAWNAFSPGLLGNIETAIKDAYVNELTALNADTDTGFIALINNGGANVERFNYREMEGLVVNTLGGNDYVVSDDVIGTATINLGVGDDKVQIGQVFRSERVKDPDGELITGITAEDVFTTLEITRGWLSNGISRASTVNGGEGNDQFTVFHNIAVLNLNGGEGDDIFTVRAFALKGSTDSERARTDMKGDGGADTILYVVNAPVGIDGGDGFDTVRIVGTEFADDFVVTDSGIFGAGLNVTYVNIEKLVADGAEGDDRYFVLSTGLEVVTEIDGGLGSDTFFIGGNPSRSPVPVISNDFKGHSGIILHNVESTEGDASAWEGLPVEGLSVNVADNEEDFFIVTESGGSTRVVEGSNNDLPGWEFDSYGIRLSRAPGAGQTVTINIVLAGMSPEDEARGFRDLEFYAVNGSDTLDGSPNGNPLGFNELTNLPNLPSLTFTAANWFQTQYIKFRAVDNANYVPDTVQPLNSPLLDTAEEGRRFVFINHTAQNSTDPDYRNAQMLSVKVQMEDNDQDYVIVTPTERGNVVLEDGFTDEFSVVLSHAPDHPVTVTMVITGDPDQVTLSSYVLKFDNDDDADASDGEVWNEPVVVTVTAFNDVVVEGFHTEYIQFTVSSEDGDETVEVNDLLVDGDFDLLGYQPIPPAKPTSYVLLPHRPLVDEPISVFINDVERPADRYTVSGNTLSFIGPEGVSELVVGTVKVNYSYHQEGYDESFVKDSVIDIYDNDTPTVIIEQVGNGSTDVIEGTGIFGFDMYRIRLSQAPADGETVTVNVESVKTRTTYGRTAYFEKQLFVISAEDDNSDLDDTLTYITFDSSDWSTWKEIFVVAIDDTVLDGNDTQVFAPDLQTVNKIRGPLIIEGAAGAGSLSLPKPLMLPNELNILAPDGVVQAFVPGAGLGADETMTVLLSDLEAVIDRLLLEDSNITDIQDLVGKTVEMSKGAGTDIILDPLRPDDRYDRFWLIKQVVHLTDADADPTNDLVELTLQNPTLIDPNEPNITAPDSESEYAITSLSVNFFADEREQIDYLFIYDNDSVANDVGALTSSDGHVLAFSANVMTIETAALQAVAKLIDPDAQTVDLEVLVGLQLEITVGPGQGRVWMIQSIDDLNPVDASKKLVTLTAVSGSGTPTNRSEFRIDGGDRYGRLIGFGMGPNVLFGEKPQPGGITYGDIEVVQIQLGRGNDTVRVDYTTNSEDHTTKRSGDFHTLTTLDTGEGNDTVTVELDAEQDGAFALNLEAGDDTVQDNGSTLGIVVFGGLGADQITTGAGDDIVFGDIGRVDYINTIDTDTDNDNEPDTLVDLIITRLGHTVPQNPVNPEVSAATSMTLTDNATTFETQYGGLVGLSVQAISPQGHVQFRTIVENDEHTLTIDRPWDSTPTTSYFYRFSARPEDQTDGQVRGPRLLWSINDEQGGNDTVNSGSGADTVIGGAANDTINAGAGADWVAGDIARFDYVPVEGNDGPTQLYTVESTNRLIGGTDTIFGQGGDDVLIGGTTHDSIDGGTEKDLIFGDNVKLQWLEGSGNAIDPRFRAPAGAIYTATGGLSVGGDFDPAINPVPGGRPAWSDFTMTLDQSLVAAQFGNDYIAGGAGDDEIFGQRGNDIIQGDGSITLTVSAARNGAGELVVQSSVEDLGGVLDGDDYIEGNAGNDVIFGGLGQDDIIGGTSNLFSLIDPTRRDDGADLIFGGAGTDRDRLFAGDTTLNGHGRDSDTILGDNGNIFRLVFADGSAYRTFNYDNYNNAAGAIKIVPRAEQLLDYTPGGPDFTIANEAGEVAINDIGAADEIHGESGDDFIYGMVGKDVLFGDGQNDVLIGGYGADWISGGTGDDGILGDDGRLLISRNPQAEPLYGVSAIPGNEQNVQIEASAGIYNGIINVNDTLKYTADLTPNNLDPAVSQNVLFRPLYANDIIYGGGGHDSIHSGAGDDAVLGAEAPTVGFTNNYDQAGTKLNGAPIQSDFAHPVNPGNVLGYNPATTMFALYDANDPLRKIQLNNITGALDKSGTAREWLLNFILEGPNDNFWFLQTGYQAVATDGDDHIFGDLGHDWLVGGTGRDTMWGGWGDDLMNADDILETFTQTDTNPSYEDLSFGGAGRDVLFGNTNGDRLIDWVGEFNSYYTPFAQFGNVSVQRLLAPSLPEFLYALSESQGADQTLGANPADPRNGEPFGEIALVIQQDSQYNQQTGAPRDPQPGNTGGAKIDVKNKPGTAGNKPLYFTADAPATSLEAPEMLTNEQLATVTDAAKQFWALELGAGDSRLATLDSAKIEVGNLLDRSLGATIGNWILIDSDAAGYGWSLDSKMPGMDLLTVVKHELGHLLGLDHDNDGLMGETLAAGSTTSSSSKSVFDYLQLAAGSRSLASTSLIDWARDTSTRKLSWSSLSARDNRVGFPEFSVDASSRGDNGKSLFGAQKKKRADDLKDEVPAEVLTEWHIEG